MAHGHNPTHSSKEPNYGCLLAFLIFMRTQLTHIYLEYDHGRASYMETHPKYLGVATIIHNDYSLCQIYKHIQVPKGAGRPHTFTNTSFKTEFHKPR